MRARWLRLVLALAVVLGASSVTLACEWTDPVTGKRWVCIADGGGPIIDANGNHWRCELSWWQPGDPQ